MLILLTIDNVAKESIININEINNCFFTPILSLVHPPTGAKIPNTNKYIDIITEV